MNNSHKSTGALVDYIEIINQLIRDIHLELLSQYNIDMPCAPIDCECTKIVHGELYVDGWNLRFLENITTGSYSNNDTNGDEVVAEIGWVDNKLSLLNWSVNEFD